MATDEQPPDGDLIRLIGLGGIGRHGVLPEERRDGQTFLVDLDLHVDTTDAAGSDDVADTVDYAVVAGDVNAIIEGEPVNLLETLAARVAEAVLAHHRVQAVDVTVHKPEAPLGMPFTDVQVRISRTAGDARPGAVPAAVPEPAVVPEPAPGVAAAALAPSGVAAHTGTGALAGDDGDEGVPAPSPAEPAAEEIDVLDSQPDGEAAVVLGLGGNVGDVRSTLRAVVDDLRESPGLVVQEVSPLARTAAVVEPDAPPQPDYLNAVVLAATTLSPNQLLDLTRSLEDSYGRERAGRWSQRTLDIDIIDYDGVSSTDERLSLPHPRANERAFVLVPWAQVDADAFLPGLSGGPVSMLAETAPDRAGVRWLALDWLDRASRGTDSGSFVVSHDVSPAPVHKAHVAPGEGDPVPPVMVPDDGAAPLDADPAPAWEHAWGAAEPASAAPEADAGDRDDVDRAAADSDAADRGVADSGAADSGAEVPEASAAAGGVLPGAAGSPQQPGPVPATPAPVPAVPEPSDLPDDDVGPAATPGSSGMVPTDDVPGPADAQLEDAPPVPQEPEPVRYEPEQAAPEALAEQPAPGQAPEESAAQPGPAAAVPEQPVPEQPAAVPTWPSPYGAAAPEAGLDTPSDGEQSTRGTRPRWQRVQAPKDDQES